MRSTLKNYPIFLHLCKRALEGSAGEAQVQHPPKPLRNDALKRVAHCFTMRFFKLKMRFAQLRTASRALFVVKDARNSAELKRKAHFVRTTA